jgi:hypothetical protein
VPKGGPNSVVEPRRINCHYRTGRGLLQQSELPQRVEKVKKKGRAPNLQCRGACVEGLGPDLQTEGIQSAGR